MPLIDDGKRLTLKDDVPNSTNVLEPLSGLARDVEIGEVYSFRIVLWVTDDAEGIQLDLAGGTAAMTWFRAHYIGHSDGLAISDPSLAVATVISRESFSGKIEVEGAFQPSSSGTVVPRLAQVAHVAGAASALKGSSSSLWESV